MTSTSPYKKKVLLKNTFMLYILIFSGYFFSFITIPYQTRILGPEYFGKVSFALAFMVFFQLLIDFGFILSATKDVSENRNNKKELSKIVGSVTIVKFLLILLSSFVLIIILLFIPKLRSDSLLYILCFLAVSVNSLMPDYLYRGLERMTAITVRTVLVKLFFTVMIFLLLKHKEDYHVIPFLNLLGNFGAVIGVFFHARSKVGITAVRIKLLDIWETFTNSSTFFYSRIASTIYGAANTVILGMFYPTGSSVIGFYTSADKLINTAKSGFSPIADSLYPYMLKQRDFKLIKKILFILMPPVIIGCLIVGVFAKDFSAFLLGEEFKEAGIILQLLLPIVVMSPLTYILGFPVLSPMGLAKYANLSVIIASIVHLIGISVLFITGLLSVFSICIITCLTQMILLMIRMLVIYKKRYLLKVGVDN